jgi:KRAB domain-containing zinc finger protein
MDSLTAQAQKGGTPATPPFTLYLCTYSASKLKDVKKHMLIHTGERSFSCDQCDYKGRRLDHLSIHKKHNHGPGELKPFKCDKCAYSGAISLLVKQHMIIHSGEKPYACDQCDYKSSRRQDLVSHEAYKHGQKNENPRTSSLYIKNSNSDLKSYQCQVCEYLADNKKAMVLHALRHNGKRLSKYDKCEFNTRKSPFLKHKLNYVKGKELQCVQCQPGQAFQPQETAH